MKEKKASMVLGILSIVFACISPVIGAILAIVGLSIKKDEHKYNRDLTLNVVGLCLSVVIFIVALAFLF